MKISTCDLKDEREKCAYDCMRKVAVLYRVSISYLCARVSSFPAICDDIEKVNDLVDIQRERYRKQLCRFRVEK